MGGDVKIDLIERIRRGRLGLCYTERAWVLQNGDKKTCTGKSKGRGSRDLPMQYNSLTESTGNIILSQLVTGIGENPVGGAYLDEIS